MQCSYIKLILYNTITIPNIHKIELKTLFVCTGFIYFLIKTLNPYYKKCLINKFDQNTIILYIKIKH